MSTLFRNSPSLSTLITPPVVWALHFLACYAVAAIYCAKVADPLASLLPVQMTIAAVTAVAAAAIGAAGWQAVGHWEFGRSASPPDDAAPQARDRFLGLATLLLCGVSLVGVLFVALPALLIGDCR